MHSFFVGLSAEMIGVNTGYLFGNYSYGTVLGYSCNNVPLLIGVNWFIIVYCAGCFTHLLEEKLIRRAGMDKVFSKRIQTISFLFDAAVLITFFDWLMEPVAVKLGYWQWSDGNILDFNYICWFSSAFCYCLFSESCRLKNTTCLRYICLLYSFYSF